jgi:hypothetical protein
MKISNKGLAVITIAVLLVGVSTLFAQTQERPRQQFQHSLHDANGDGICDICEQPVGSGLANAQGNQAKKGSHWEPGDGFGNQGSGLKDGSRYGSQSGRRIGAQDGTGPYCQIGGQRGRQGQGSGRRGRS